MRRVGFKDTFGTFAGERVRVLMVPPVAGLFMYHCHNLENEDGGMLRNCLFTTVKRAMPDLALALRWYRRLARGYDAATRGIDCKRWRAIGPLRLQPGNTVLDAVCGTGLAAPARASDNYLGSAAGRASIAAPQCA